MAQLNLRASDYMEPIFLSGLQQGIPKPATIQLNGAFRHNNSQLNSKCNCVTIHNQVVLVNHPVYLIVDTVALLNRDY